MRASLVACASFGCAPYAMAIAHNDETASPAEDADRGGSMRMRRMIAPLLLVLLAALPAQAQETRGNINGIVQDKGGVIPGAVVTVRNTETSQTLPLVTNNRGYFEALLLNPGTYSVQVELTGYRGY